MKLKDDVEIFRGSRLLHPCQLLLNLLALLTDWLAFTLTGLEILLMGF